MPELRVKVVIDTDQLRWWATRHRALEHESVATALTAAADHYEQFTGDDGVEPSAPIYPTGLDRAELRQWADWHTDRRAAGVAHTLFDAARSAPHSSVR